MYSSTLRSPPKKLFATLVIGLGIAISNAQNSFSQGHNETIVKTGDAALDGNGTFGFVRDVILNNQGDLVFRSTFNGTTGGTTDDEGIFGRQQDNFSQLIREGGIAPDGTSTFAALGPVTLADSGAIVFRSKLTGTANATLDDTGIFRIMGGTTDTIVRESDQAPDGNGTFADLTHLAPAMINDSGTVTFNSGFNGTAGGNSDRQGIFSGSGGARVQIARTNGATPGGGVFTSTGGVPHINNSGDITFGALFDDGVPFQAGIFRSSGGTISTLLTEGQAAPDGNGTIDFLSTTVAVNDSNDIIARATMTGTTGGTTDDSAYIRVSNGTAAQLYREGNLAPDGNGTFIGLPNGFALNNNGSIAFQGVLDGNNGGAAETYGIFVGDGGALTQVARGNQSAPNGNGVFGIFSSSVGLNNSDVVLFSTTLAGTNGGTTDNKALFLGDGTDLIEFGRSGETLEGSTITQFQIYGSGSHGPKRSGFNDLGQVAYVSILADGNRVLRVFTPDLHWRSTSSGNWSDDNNWTLGLGPANVHDVFVDPGSNLTIQGATSDVTIRDFQLGGGAGSPTLNWNSGVVMTARDISIDGGSLTGGGTFNANTVSINASGSVIVNGDFMTFNSPTTTNHGLIQNQDGFIEFNGDLFNTATGQVSVAGEAGIVVSGDFDNQGSLFIDEFTSTEIGGEYRGVGDFTGGGFLNIEGTLSPGNSTASILMDGIVSLGSNALFDIELGGINLGEFDQIFGMDDFNIDGDLAVSMFNGFQLTSGMEFIIADVDGTLTGQFGKLAEGGLVGNFGGQDLFISYSRGDGNDVGLFTAVPEPGSIAILGLAGLAGALTRRRRPIAV